MAVFNLGSINIDLIYTLGHFPEAGETLAASGFLRLPGGKGANQSVALAAAGAEVFHIGAMSRHDDWLSQYLDESGVNISHIQYIDSPSGHAIVMVEATGENRIILFPGANHMIDMEAATAPLRSAGAGDESTGAGDESAGAGDWALLQNETNGGAEFVAAARRQGLRIAYAAAPFDAEITLTLLPHVDLLIVNAIEAAALMDATGGGEESLGVDHLVITHGGDGAAYSGIAGACHQPAFAVKAVDTTGAGDCFCGYFLAGLASGGDVPSALRLASAAAALQVTRQGAAGAIPHRKDVNTFLEEHG